MYSNVVANTGTERATASPKKKRRKFGDTIDNKQQQQQQQPTTQQSGATVTSLQPSSHRGLDLSKYGAREASMYELCRDWMSVTSSSLTMTAANAGSSSSSKRCTTSTESNKVDAQNGYLIYKLPEAVPVTTDDEAGRDTIDKLNEAIRVDIRCSEQADMELVASLDVDDTIKNQAARESMEVVAHRVV